MDWRTGVNRALEKSLGLNLVKASTTKSAGAPETPAKRTAAPTPRVVDTAPAELVRPAEHPEFDRLLEQPVFIMSTVRSGSTLLRVLLNAHSQIYAPHELHIRRLRVAATTSLAQRAMDMLGLNEADLEHLLWDRVLQRELLVSGKSILVDKTPSNAFAYARLQTVWPDARFIFLLRHPASIAESWSEVTAHKWSREEAIGDSMRYMRALERARKNVTGLTVRYEDLTADPAAVTQQICEYLGVPWEASMLEYGATAPQLVKGVGDWSDSIRSGSVQAGRNVPEVVDIPPRLVPMSRKWGYPTEAHDLDDDEPRLQAEEARADADLPDDDTESDGSAG